MPRVLAAVLLLLTAVYAQTAPAPDAQQIAKQFGPGFQVISKFPVLVGDLDGDGAEDAVVVATGESPLLDEAQYGYKVVDPYNAYFGFGDPKVTAQFAVPSGNKPPMLLVVQNWRAPKARFVIINIPFEKLSIGRVLVKKKVLRAILAEEMTGMKSAVYWDGKKWKWKEQAIE